MQFATKGFYGLKSVLISKHSQSNDARRANFKQIYSFAFEFHSCHHYDCLGSLNFTFCVGLLGIGVVFGCDIDIVI